MSEGKDPVGPWFVWVITILIPIEFVAMIAWWFYQSATVFDPEGWWRLMSTSSVGTVVIQISVLAVVLFLTNSMWLRRIRPSS